MKNMIRVENTKLELIDGIVEGMVVTENNIYSFDVAEWDATGNEPTKYEITVFENNNGAIGKEKDIIIAAAVDVLKMFGFTSNKVKMNLQLLARNSEVDQDKLKIKEEEKINMENMKHFTIIYKDGKVVNQNTLTSVKQIIELDRLNINLVINNLNNDILVDNTKLETTLIKCDLVEDIESIDVNGDYMETDLGEYLIFDNYTNAENEAIEQCKQIIEECGLTENLIFEAEIQGLIDTQWFIDFWEEIHESSTYEEDIQYIASDEEMEQLENGEISEEEIRDNYFNSLQDSIKGQEMDEYKYQFGEEQFHDTLIKNNLIDIDTLSQWCVDMDGVAHFLAHYDGEEIEENGYYIYRVN